MISKVLIAGIGLISLGLAVSCGSTTGSNNASANKTSSPSNASSTANAAPPASARKADMTKTAEDLAKEYKADNKSAEKYKDKVVEVTGKFDRSSGTAEQPEVQFETGSSVWVTCVLSPSAYQTAAKFEKGQEIKLVGTTDPYSITGPRFKNCEIAQ